jgi:hypothetical protein
MIGGALLAMSLLLALVLPATAANGVKVAYPAVLLLVFWFLSTRDEWWRRAPVSPEAPAEVKGLRLLLCWTLLTWAFFELMPTLLSHYILPAYPGMALLCGYAAVRLMEGEKMPVSRWLSLALFGLGAGLSAGGRPIRGLRITSWRKRQGISPPHPVLRCWRPGRGTVCFRSGSGGPRLRCAAWPPSSSAVPGRASPSWPVLRAAFVIGWHIRIFMLPSQVWVQPTETARLALEDVCGVPGEACAMTPPERILRSAMPSRPTSSPWVRRTLHPPETPLDLPTDDDAPIPSSIS